MVEEAESQTTDLNPPLSQQDPYTPEFLQNSSETSPDLQIEVFQSDDELDVYDETSVKSQMQDDTPGQPEPPFPTTSLQQSLEDVSRLVELPHFIPLPRQRFFWEIFSGPNSPLTTAIHDSGIPCIQPFDLLIDNKFDILNDSCYELMLRIVATRLVGSLHAAPPCTEYSLLKLKNPGPRPCRSPQCMDSPLFDDEECHQRFYSSREILRRTEHLLRLNHIHGGYSSLEQPSSAMSWDEDFILLACQEFLVEEAVFSHCATCRSDEEPWSKEWKFVSNIPGFSDASLICTCNYKHSSFAGKRNPDGTFKSKNTSEYPQKLVNQLHKFLHVEQLKSDKHGLWDWNSVMDLLPERAPQRLVPIPDGGGLASSSLWPIPFSEDVFRQLRKDLESLCFKHRLHTHLPQHIRERNNTSPFSSKVQQDIDECFRTFFRSKNLDPSFQVPVDQPFRLYAFYALAQLALDPDAKLLHTLVDGVDLGIDQCIEPSGTWPLKQEIQDPGSNEFFSFEDNWKSAEADEETLEKLIQKEIDDGFVSELPSMEAATALFGNLFAIGKLGIASQQPDKPRLVSDSTISGLNPASNKAIQEKYSFPRLWDLQYSLSSATKSPLILLNVDIKSAHKRIKVQKKHQGLLAFRFRERIFHYKVLHFGGPCSAYFWTRTAGILLRCIHKFLHLFHVGMVFVDDFIFGFYNHTSGLQAALVLMFMSFLQVPISWNKMELGTSVTWIGWQLDTWSDTVSITSEKIHKIVSKLKIFSSPGKYLRKDVEKLTGTILWITDMFPHIRWMLGILYTILSRTGLQLVRLNKQQISFVIQHLDESGTLTQFLDRPFIPQGATIQRLGKVSFSNLGLLAFRNACFDTAYAWTTFLSCRSNRIQIFDEEAKNISIMKEFFEGTVPMVPFSQPRRFTIQAGADAFADSLQFGLGAWIQSPAGALWCSIQASRHDIADWLTKDSMQAYILSFEMLAQLLVILLFRHQESIFRGCDIEVATRLDNQAAEAILHQGFTQLPVPAKMTRAVQILCSQTRIRFSPFRASSEENHRADDLSRGRVDQEDPQSQIHFPIRDLMETLFHGTASHLARLRGVKR